MSEQQQQQQQQRRRASDLTHLQRDSINSIIGTDPRVIDLIADQERQRAQIERLTRQRDALLPYARSIAASYLDSCGCLIDDPFATQHAPDCVASVAAATVKDIEAEMASESPEGNQA